MRMTLPLCGELELSDVPVDEFGVLEVQHTWQSHPLAVQLWLDGEASPWDSDEACEDETGTREASPDHGTAAPFGWQPPEASTPLHWPEAEALRLQPLLAQADAFLQHGFEALVLTAAEEDSTARSPRVHREELHELAELSDAKFLQAMRPQRLAYHTTPQAIHVEADFGINPELTQYVLCAKLDAQVQLLEVAFES